MRKDVQPVFLLHAKKVLSAILFCFVIIYGSKAAANPGSNKNRSVKKIFTAAPIDTLIVKGKVASASGEPLPGVTIEVKGTSVGSTSGPDGIYAIRVPDGKGTLVFSFVGLQSQEVAISNRSLIDVTMGGAAKALDEVVVIGYGTERKANLTGAIATLNMKQKENMPITNVSQALHGMSGVWVNQAGGKPGQDFGSIRIRGVGTTNNSSPLVLVDGIEYNMNEINPATIENITVLKDASAAIMVHGQLMELF